MPSQRNILKVSLCRHEHSDGPAGKISLRKPHLYRTKAAHLHTALVNRALSLNAPSTLLSSALPAFARWCSPPNQSCEKFQNKLCPSACKSSTPLHRPVSCPNSLSFFFSPSLCSPLSPNWLLITIRRGGQKSLVDYMENYDLLCATYLVGQLILHYELT